MKIDTAIQEFIERYDDEAIRSIHDISRDYSRRIAESKIKAFKLQDGFDTFCEFLEGYGNYKIKNKDNENASPQDAIVKSVQSFIDTQLFEACDILYPELDGFVKGYIKGIQQLTECVESIKNKMMDSDVNLEYVGCINDFADQFMEKLHESFDPTMERFLWASGYNARKVLFNGHESPYSKSKKSKTEEPVFV